MLVCVLDASVCVRWVSTWSFIHHRLGASFITPHIRCLGASFITPHIRLELHSSHHTFAVLVTHWVSSVHLTYMRGAHWVTASSASNSSVHLRHLCISHNPWGACTIWVPSHSYRWIKWPTKGQPIDLEAGQQARGTRAFRYLRTHAQFSPHAHTEVHRCTRIHDTGGRISRLITHIIDLRVHLIDIDPANPLAPSIRKIALLDVREDIRQKTSLCLGLFG